MPETVALLERIARQQTETNRLLGQIARLLGGNAAVTVVDGPLPLRPRGAVEVRRRYMAD